jgi:hypothetical protein
MYRTGSQIRVRISAPNGDQPIWSFGETDPAGQADVAIGYGGSMPSRLELPVVPGVSAPTGLPPCPGLRGEPCRDYQPLENTTASIDGGTSEPPPTSGPPTSGSTQGKCTAGHKKAGGKKHKKHKKHKKKRHCGSKKKRKGKKKK